MELINTTRDVRMHLLLAVLVCLTQSAFAQGVTDPEIAPQQSTTGPLPPPGVAPKVEAEAEPDAGETTITGVPGYAWRHGCGPTAVGMVLGYYDGHGFDDLFPGSASTQTADVDQGIASQGGAGDPKHHEDYSLPKESGSAVLPDKSAPPTGDEHPHDCVADFMKTSWSSAGNKYGWSWSTHVAPAFTSYAQLRNPRYLPTVAQYKMSTGALSWTLLTQEIDNDRPMVFLVDTDGNGGTDHFVTVVGYRDAPSQQYGCLDTWSPVDVIRWCDFAVMASGQSWGIYAGWTFELSLSTDPVVRRYDAGLGSLPDAQGWPLYDTDPAQPECFLDAGALHQGPTSASGNQAWLRSDLPFSFSTGDFVLEATVKVVQSTVVDPCRAGYVLAVVDHLGRIFRIWLASDRVYLFNLENNDCSATGQVLNLDTTDDFHTYRLIVDGTIGRLYVDTDPNAALILAIGPPNASFSTDTVAFGDLATDAWSESLTSSVAYGHSEHTLTVTEINETWGTVLIQPDLSRYLFGSEVTLVAQAVEGKRLRQWQIFDPNFPGDANHAEIDTNTTTTVVVDDDREVQAVWKCGSGVDAALPLLPMMGMALVVLAFRRGRRC
ncbi:MAG: hypothetical protein JXQ73_21835 [Phycisphaerae bacterium]|nr:hypothetical protein [Phycisphaerae bacterium]